MGAHPQERDGDGPGGGQGQGERPLPKMEPDPSLIGRALIGSGAPEPGSVWWRRSSRRKREG